MNHYRLVFPALALALFGCSKQPNSSRPILTRLLSEDKTVSGPALADFDALQDPQKRELLPGLEKALASGHPQVRSNAACVIARMGTMGQSLVPSLRRQLALEKDPETKLWMQTALELVLHPPPVPLVWQNLSDVTDRYPLGPKWSPWVSKNRGIGQIGSPNS